MMTVREVTEKFGEELEDGAGITIRKYLTDYHGELAHDDEIAEFIDDDVYSFTFFPPRDMDESGQLYIELAGEWNRC